MKAPSKKLILISSASIIALGAVIFAVKGPNVPDFGFGGSIDQGSAEKIDIQALAERTRDIDTDGDGLKDWEEELWRSDPKLKDTDGDGTDDGEEVKQSRNPVIKGPNDKSVAFASASTTAEAEALNATEKFSRELFGRYMELKSEGQTLNQVNQAAIVEEMLQSESVKPKAKVYFLAEMKTSSDESPAAIKAYGNAMGEFLKKESPKSINEMEIFSKSLQNHDEKIVEELDPTIKGYTDLINDYLGMKVPKSAALLHLSVINSMSAVLEDIRGFRYVWEDPMRAYAALANYKSDGVNMYRALVSLRAYFSQRGISFGKEEAGYSLFSSP